MNHNQQNSHSEPLLAEIKRQCETRTGTDLSPIINKIHSLYGETVRYIVLYGSCLRTRQYKQGILDLYVVVSNYRAAYKDFFYASINSLLPPNVFYFEAGDGGNTLRAKYAVISVDDFYKGINNWFHPYLWARFAQPMRLIYAESDDTRNAFYHQVSSSVYRYMTETLPVLGIQHVDTEQIWTNALSLSYNTELRPEKKSRYGEITSQALDDLSRLTALAQPALSDILTRHGEHGYLLNIDSSLTNKYRRYWRIRQWQGKLLSVLRLIKAAVTFRDCADYAAWKIKRHSGIEIEVTPALRKFPILLGFKMLWQLVRRDVIR